MMVIRHLRPKHRAEIEGKTVPLSKFLWWIRLFIIAVMVFAVAAGVGGWIMYGLYEDIHQAQKQALQTQQSGHQDRLNEDASLQKQIADAVCTFVDPIAPGNPQVDKLRDKYGCPYTPTTPASPSATPSKPSATPSSSPSTAHTPLVGPTVTVQTPGPTVTATATATATKTVAPTSSPAIINLPKLICLPSGVCL